MALSPEKYSRTKFIYLPPPMTEKKKNLHVMEHTATFIQLLYAVYMCIVSAGKVSQELSLHNVVLIGKCP